MSDNKRIIWLDYVRATACILVIILHVTAAYVKEPLAVTTIDWNIANIINSAARSCVPLFFMISGYIFFSEKTPKTKNFIKLFSALFFYSLVVIFMRFSISIVKPDLINSNEYYFFSAPSFYHLWFFYPLIVIYFFARFINVRKDINVPYIMILIVIIFSILNPKFGHEIKYLSGFNIENYFMIDGDFVFYLLYALSGAVLKNYSTKSKKQSYALFLLFIICTITISYLTKSGTYSRGEYFTMFHEYTSPLVFISALCVFVIFKSIKPRNSKVINFISEKSLPIYGFHAIILYVIQRFFNYQSHSALIFIPVIFFIVLSTSSIIATVITKLDKHRYIS